MVVQWMVNTSIREGGGAGPATDNVMETVVEEREISTFIQTPWEHSL